LLINFSLFITKFVVDFSNQLSTQIAISGFNAQVVGNGNAMGTGSAWKVDITNQILNLMGIASLFNVSAGADTLRHASWGYIFGTAIMFLVTSFVLFAGGFLLIIRFALLNLFMVLSPFMFIGWILPPLSNLTSKYWDAFLKRAFFAPVYFLFLYFSLEILKAFQTSIGLAGKYEVMAKTFGAAESANVTLSATQSTMPFFILICIFMIASIVIAQKIGADGAGTAIRYGQMARQKLQRGVTRGVGAGTVGVAARTGRNTIGRAAYAATQNEKVKSYAARSAIGKGLYKTAQYGAGATFDARNVGGVGKQLNLGQSDKGGFKKRIDDSVKAQKAFAKDLGFVEIDTPEGKRKVAAKAAEVKARKEMEKVEREQAKNIAVKIKEFSSQNIGLLDQAIASYTENIDEMDKKIKAKQVEFDSKNTSVERKESLKIEIENDKKGLQTERDNLTIRREAKRVAVEKSISAERLTAAKQAETTARSSNNYEGVQTAKADQAKHQIALDAIDGKLDEEITKLGDELGEINDIIENKNNKLSNIATAEVKYSKQIDYMNQVKRQQRMLGSVATPGLSTGGGGLVGASLVGGAAAFGGGALIGLNTAGAKNYELSQVIESLDKEYGKGGAKTLGKQKAKDRIKQEKEVVKEIEGDDAEKADKDGDKKDAE
nr:hypothetical protein [Candidatus Paceibacterota bacterium]